jgi:hypothetical protein
VTLLATTLASRAFVPQVSLLEADRATRHNRFRAAGAMVALLEAVITSQRLSAGLVGVSLLVAVAATSALRDSSGRRHRQVSA